MIPGSGIIPEGLEIILKEMATHSSILAWEMLWTEEPGRLQSMGSQRVEHNLVTEEQFTYLDDLRDVLLSRSMYIFYK